MYTAYRKSVVTKALSQKLFQKIWEKLIGDFGAEISTHLYTLSCFLFRQCLEMQQVPAAPMRTNDSSGCAATLCSALSMWCEKKGDKNPQTSIARNLFC